MADGVRVKICGLVRRADALAADAAGADYLGVVLTPGFARSVPPERARSVVDGTSALKVAVLVDEEPRVAEKAAVALGADVLQLHGSETVELFGELRRRGPWRLWKAVRARSIDDVRAAVSAYAEHADGLLVEGWREGVTGGGGARLALEPAATRALMPEGLDFVLAGGLRADTVAEAVARFRPSVVDVSSGVERAVGEKDPDLVRDFVEAARAAISPTEKDMVS